MKMIIAAIMLVSSSAIATGGGSDKTYEIELSKCVSPTVKYNNTTQEYEDCGAQGKQCQPNSKYDYARETLKKWATCAPVETNNN